MANGELTMCKASRMRHTQRVFSCINGNLSGIVASAHRNEGYGVNR
jgi:hypothetical protein